jgi:ABC-type multidrug transport system fused ATPase/permease subunit
VGLKKSLWIALFSMVATFFFFGSMASILLVGGMLCQKNLLKVGDIASFMLYMVQILINF